MLGTRANFKDMFDWGNFRENGKKSGRKYGRKKIWEKIVGKGYLVKRGGRRENWWSSGVFHPGSPKINLPKSRRKQRRKFVLFIHTSKRLFCPLVHSHSKSNTTL